MATTVVVGNEKGGSGKTTVAIHLAAFLLRKGDVGVIDLDTRQRSMSRFFENRDAFRNRRDVPLSTPRVWRVEASEARDRVEAEEADRRAVSEAVVELGQSCRYLVIDTPGASTNLARHAHYLADVLITPLNDSFVDLDVLARINAADGEIESQSVYSGTVWEARRWRSEQDLPPPDWVVIRNRIASLEARNHRRVRDSLDKLAERIGFRVAHGFSERVIFRELFLNGLTLLDLSPSSTIARYSSSHVAARQELRVLVNELDIEGRNP